MFKRIFSLLKVGICMVVCLRFSQTILRTTTPKTIYWDSLMIGLYGSEWNQRWSNDSRKICQERRLALKHSLAESWEPKLSICRWLLLSLHRVSCVTSIQLSLKDNDIQGTDNDDTRNGSAVAFIAELNSSKTKLGKPNCTFTVCRCRQVTWCIEICFSSDSNWHG